MSEDMSSLKLALEVEKLRTEIRQARRTFWAQIANTATILGLGVAALYFFQTPQITEMERTRLSNERQYVTNSVIAAYGMKETVDRDAMLTMLTREFPQYEFVAALRRGTQLVGEQLTSKPGESAKDKCITMSRALDQVANARTQLKSRIEDEMPGRGQSRQAGAGPIVRLLRVQEEELADREGRIRSDMQQLKC
jgi:hypothetical protein